VHIEKLKSKLESNQLCLSYGFWVRQTIIHLWGRGLCVAVHIVALLKIGGPLTFIRLGFRMDAINALWRAKQRAATHKLYIHSISACDSLRIGASYWWP